MEILYVIFLVVSIRGKLIDFVYNVIVKENGRGFDFQLVCIIECRYYISGQGQR